MSHIALRQTADAQVVQAASQDCAGPAAATAALDLAFVADVGGLEALEADWNALHAAAGRQAQIFQTFSWCWHWCRHYLGRDGEGSSLAIVTGRIGGRLVLVMPLAVQRRVGLRELVWLGEPVTQYGDVLATPEAAHPEALAKAWSFAVAQTRADVANLRKVRADAVAAPLLERIGARITCTEEAPFLDLTHDHSFEAWEARRLPPSRKNRKRQARRLADMGHMAHLCQSGTAEAGALAARAVALKRRSFADKGVISPALSDARFEAFFADVAADAARPAHVKSLALTVDDTPAALKVVLDDGRTTFLHIAVFDPGFEKCGAGAVLLEQLIRMTIDNGCSRLDLLAPRHGYKMDFADGVVLVNDHALALSAKGWAYTHGYLRLRRRLKASVEAMPAPLRRLVHRLAA